MTKPDPTWTAVEIIIDETVVRDLIPRLKELGERWGLGSSLNRFVTAVSQA